MCLPEPASCLPIKALSGARGGNRRFAPQGRRLSIGAMWKINQRVLSFCQLGMVGILPVMTLIVFVQVILRYGFHNSLSWVEELARYMLVWVTCLGSVYASEKGLHVSVDVLRSRLRGRMRIAAVLIIHVSVLFFFVAGAWHGAVYALSGWIQRSASLNLRMTFLYAAIPVAFGLMVLTQTERFVMELKLALSGEPPDNPQAGFSDMQGAGGPPADDQRKS